MALTEQTSENTGNRLGNCEVCDSNVSKYTCPRCELRTCSLTCVKIHKDELECCGTRDKTLFKPLNKFNNLDLLSDYRLLEDISRSVIKFQKDKNKRYTRFQTILPIQLFKLRRTAYTRGVKLMFLPQNFSRHQENTTYYDWKSKNLYWRVKWIFFTSSGKKTFIDDKVLDKMKLGTAIAKYLSPEEADPQLDLYYSANYSGITLLLKAEKTVGKFNELDMSQSLRENLRGKKIIEFPTIYVILKHQKDEFELFDSDEEEEGGEEHQEQEKKADDQICEVID